MVWGLSALAISVSHVRTPRASSFMSPTVLATSRNQGFDDFSLMFLSPPQLAHPHAWLTPTVPPATGRSGLLGTFPMLLSVRGAPAPDSLWVRGTPAAVPNLVPFLLLFIVVFQNTDEYKHHRVSLLPLQKQTGSKTRLK